MNDNPTIRLIRPPVCLRATTSFLKNFAGVKHMYFYLSIALLLTSISAANAAEPVEAEEPSQAAYLTIDGVKHKIMVGEESELVIDNKRHRLALTLDPNRRFKKAGISFSYNGQMHYSYEALSEDVDHWSIDGNNAVVMVQMYREKIDDKAILKQFESQYESMNASVKTKKTVLKFGKKKLRGYRLNIALGDIHLMQEIFVIQKDDSTTALFLQDTLGENRRNTQEFLEMKHLIGETLDIDA